jgi:hypothetical protein
MTLSSSHYITANFPSVHLLPEYRPQLDVSLSPEGDRNCLACCVLSQNLPQFDFGEFPHHPLETNTPMILNSPTNLNPVHLSQVSVEASQLVHLYLPTDQEGNFRLRYLRATRLKCARAPSFMKCGSRRMISGTSPGNQSCCFQSKLCNSTL